LVLIFISEPNALLAVSETVYEPPVLYVCEGFGCVLVPPSPKPHSHVVGLLALWSLKLTVKGASPLVFSAEKSETGTSPPPTCIENDQTGPSVLFSLSYFAITF